MSSKKEAPAGARGAEVPMSRRESLVVMGGVAVGALAGACGSGSSPALCTLYPQQTQGPFYLGLGTMRRDITEGRPGTPLNLTIEVVRASDCAALTGVAVDIWHCDAGGLYSGYPGQLGGVDTSGQTFLRGTQVSGSDGKVVFDTLYPGWYPGRTTHIHFKVRPAAGSEATSQLYFPEDVTTNVYQSAPYDARGQKDTSNAADAIAQAGGIPPLVSTMPSGAGFAATLRVSVAG